MITGRNVTVNGGHYSQHNYGGRQWHCQKLYEYVAKGALHDSQECSQDVGLQEVEEIVSAWSARFPCTSSSSKGLTANPKFLSTSPLPPDLLVIENVIRDVLIWLHDPLMHSLVMWLYDEKKECTSLIAHVVAKILSRRKELSATFFAGSPPPDILTFVPTIAYQLGQNRPAARSRIAKILEEDILILHSNLQKQLEALVVNPLTEPGQPLVTSNVILVHALEDIETDYQTVLAMLMNALVSIESCHTGTAQRLLIIGRPTAEFQTYFSRLPASSIFQRPIRDNVWQQTEEDFSRERETLRRVEEMKAHVKQDEEALGQVEKAMEKRRQELGEQEALIAKRMEGVKSQEANLTRLQEQLQKRVQALNRKQREIRSEQTNSTKPVQVVGADSTAKPGSPLGLHWLFSQRIRGNKDAVKAETPCIACIALIGITGSGKTNMVNCLRQGKTCDDLGDDILLVSPIKIDCPELGRSIVLIDTPGRDHGNLSWLNILTMVKEWVDKHKGPEKHGAFKLSGILYVHPIVHTNFTAPPLEVIERALGKEVADNVLVVSTMWDKRADEEDHKRMERNFQQMKRDCRADRFDNRVETAWRLVDRLLTGTI